MNMAESRRLRAAVTFCILCTAGNMLIRSGLPSLIWEMGASAVKEHAIPVPEKVDSRISSYLQEMFDAMRAEGLYPIVREVYSWLAKNAHKHGFILRYPQEKEDITGTSYEPWHYRYVGKEAAEEIYAEQICLEEYMENTIY